MLGCQDLCEGLADFHQQIEIKSAEIQGTELGIVWLHSGPQYAQFRSIQTIFSDVATTLSKDSNSFESLSSPAWLKSQCHHEVTPALVET